MIKACLQKISMADKSEFISCIDEKTANDLKKRIRMCLDFIYPFRWLIDSYISDFFVDDLWEKILPCWRRKLEMMSPPQQSILLDSQVFTENKELQTLLPLSMLAYIKCIENLSINRECVDLDESETVQKIKSVLGQLNNTQNKETLLFATKDKFVGKHKDEEKCDTMTANTDSKKRKLSPSSINKGQDFSLHNIFRKHVKPKKQHEIGRLAKGVSLLSQVSKCKDIVDVGAGLGHLSRILAFNQGLAVTTVEAAGTHAPKAFKYDREMEKNLSKVLKRLPKEESESDSVEMKSFDQVKPSHVVCRISPDITPQGFLKLLEQQYTEPNSKNGHSFSLNENTNSDSASKDFKFGGRKEELLAGDCKTVKEFSVEGKDGLGISDDNSYDSSNKLSSDDFNSAKCVSDKGKECDDNRRKFSAGDCKSTARYMCDSEIESNGQSELSAGNNETAVSASVEQKKFSEPVKDKKLLLCGLHACGDLTSTLLKMYVSCDNIVGVASVGCCYMKLTCRCDPNYHPDTDDQEGYPMSDVVKTIPTHQLSYAGREMACHFVDVYKARLQDDSDHLRVHCYRAAFQHIVIKLHPEFDRGKIKLTVKHATDLPFEKYCEINLKKLGYNEDIPQDLILEAKEYLKQWKNVMSFYTIRLALSPVLETIILLDRLLYLYQHGILSILIPIFDPKISPRNFLLLSHKPE